MSGACPAPGPDDPLVRSLLGTVDCNVQDLVQTGYATLFQPSGPFVAAVTAALTIYVALFGYRLMLGRAQLNVGDLALTAVKLGVVLALATQWGAYQAIVYRTLFFGPQQLADLIGHGFRAHSSALDGDVFDRLQRAFTDLTSFSPAEPPGGAPPPPAPGPNGAPTGGGVLSTLLSKAGFDSMLMLIAAVILLLSSLGVLLACKVVLGLLLAAGPIFIALLLFDSTRGLFEGWLRASLGFAFAPLAVTLLLGLALNLLDPWLQQIETMRQVNSYTPGVAFGVMVLVVVFAGVATGLVAAGAAIAGGFKLPRLERRVDGAARSIASTVVSADPGPPPRATRTAAAMAAQERRDALVFARSAATPIIHNSADPRTPFAVGAPARDDAALTPQTRLGQGRRGAGPRGPRSGPRQDVGAALQTRLQEGATPR